MASPAVRLVLGPMLRHVDQTSATIWVETSAAAEVSILGRRARTFCVAGHHYALVAVTGLAVGTDTAYTVELDGIPAWPDAADPRPGPRILTLPAEGGINVAFGSCRLARPDTPPWSLPPEAAPEGTGVDTLRALSLAIQAGERVRPHLLLLLGDQIYADAKSFSGMDEVLRQPDPVSSTAWPGARNFEEYAAAYQAAWAPAEVRWLLATVPTAMIFDDHEVRNNWNVSASWLREATATAEWAAQLRGALTAYWLYQHLGNLPPDLLRAEGVWRDMANSDLAARLTAFVDRAAADNSENRASRFSYARDLGRSRLVVLDTRSTRILEPGRRHMMSDPEWEVAEQRLRGDCDHLLVASSVPLLLHPAQHNAEGWNEALSDGALGYRAAEWSERLRRNGNLEQWAAFSRSFQRLTRILDDVAAGRRGRPPTTVLLLSGDVHHSYLARMSYPPALGPRSPVVQVVSSPLRNVLPNSVRRALRVAHWRPLRVLTRLLAASVGVPAPRVPWRVTFGPVFGNVLGTLWLTPDRARIRLYATVSPRGTARLRSVHETTVSGAREGAAIGPAAPS